MRGGDEVAAGQLTGGHDEIEVGGGLFGGGAILGGDAAGGVGNNGGALNEGLESPLFEGDLGGGVGDDFSNVGERSARKVARSAAADVTKAGLRALAQCIWGERGELKTG